jgi:choline kinase
MSNAVDHAIVLAAGNGDRFRSGSGRSKLATPVAGTPLLVRTLRSARLAGITDAHVVLGYDAEYVRTLAMAQAPDGLTLHFHLNRQWHEENGRSVLEARAGLTERPFAVLMGDHIFEPQALTQLGRVLRADCEALVGIDRRTTQPDIVAEATKVQTRDGRVIAIGKTIDPFDGLDTGLFVCDTSLFDALGDSCADGDTTLSGGIARLAAQGLVRGVDIGSARWCDVDTVADLAMAEVLTEAAPGS